jgi:UDP-3-O-[3-hydroxymyristoyl] N-acetylglucosamine deacetylase/UDP-3-O-[3-hydroxymyristoyl] N-acetylglucosamine deacetylase/3-hydroxyacyl-[acyl-carrier-protein] dehydratase
VFDESGPIDNRLRFPNECARHKALDLIGDLALAGRRLAGQFVAYRSGHRLHAELTRQLIQRFAAAPLRASA